MRKPNDQSLFVCLCVSERWMEVRVWVDNPEIITSGFKCIGMTVVVGAVFRKTSLTSSINCRFVYKIRDRVELCWWFVVRMWIMWCRRVWCKRQSFFSKLFGFDAAAAAAVATLLRFTSQTASCFLSLLIHSPLSSSSFPSRFFRSTISFDNRLISSYWE